MKRGYTALLLIILTTVACRQNTNSSALAKKDYTVKLTELNTQHVNKEYMEWLLNNYKENFVISKLSYPELNNNPLVLYHFSCRTEISNINVQLYFFNHQNDVITFTNK